MPIYDRFIDVLLPATRDVFLYFGPYALIPLFLYAAWRIWHHYIKMHNIYNADWTLMEVVLPKLAVKSPQSMEVIFGVFNQTYAGNWWTKFTQGTIRTWFSLEVVSIEGRVHFFIRTLSFFKHAIEIAIYGEYPNAKVLVVEDYMKNLRYGKDSDLEVYLWELGLTKPDPYPIRTYVDYGLDKEGVEEEYRTDPTTPIIEYLSSLGPKQYAVVQILVMAAKDRYKLKEDVKGEKKKKKGRKGSWKDEGEELIKAIDRSTSKNGYDCGIRLLYAADKSVFRLDHKLALKSLFSVFNSPSLNAFKTARETGLDSVIGGWLGWNKYKEGSLKRKMFNACRLRSYFYPPYAEKPFVLNSEELATIYRFSPGASIGAGVERVESKTLEPPLELPE